MTTSRWNCRQLESTGASWGMFLACMRSAQAGSLLGELVRRPLLSGCIIMHLSHFSFAFPLPASHLHKCVVAVTVRQPLEKRSVPPTPAACRIKSRGRRQLVVHSPETPVNTVRVPARAVVVLRSAGTVPGRHVAAVPSATAGQFEVFIVDASCKFKFRCAKNRELFAIATIWRHRNRLACR